MFIVSIHIKLLITFRKAIDPLSHIRLYLNEAKIS